MRETAIGVQYKRGAIEHQFILAADLIEIDEWKSCFRDARDGNVHAPVHLRPIERRAVGRDQNFSAAFGETFDYVVFPDVFANRHANAHAFEIDRPRHRAGGEHALFIEHAVVRQICLVADGFDLAAVDQHRRIIKRALVGPDGAGQDSGAGTKRFRKLFDGIARRFLKRGLQYQILRRIAGDKQLRQDDEVRAKSRRGVARRDELGDVASDVANYRVQLRERDFEMCGGHKVSRSSRVLVCHCARKLHLR